MNSFELTLESPAENLAFDEVLLHHQRSPLLRFWQPASYFVVLGYANRAAVEVRLPFCQANAIPVLRRCTGGGTVLQGPGCLNYTLILPTDASGPFHSISATNQFIMRQHQTALTELLKKPVAVEGCTDLTVDHRKFSGNAQRRSKDYLIFHGSFLLNFDLDLIERALPLPSQQPGYRARRAHTDFLSNLQLEAESVMEALAKAWNASATRLTVPNDVVKELVAAKYQLDEWTFKY